MKTYLIIGTLFLPVASGAQTANDLVGLWLQNRGVAARDYVTCDPSPQPVIGTDGICSWGNDLGPQPTASELKGLQPSWTDTSQLSTKDVQLAKAKAFIAAGDLASALTILLQLQGN